MHTNFKDSPIHASYQHIFCCKARSRVSAGGTEKPSSARVTCASVKGGAGESDGFAKSIRVGRAAADVEADAADLYAHLLGCLIQHKGHISIQSQRLIRSGGWKFLPFNDVLAESQILRQ